MSPVEDTMTIEEAAERERIISVFIASVSLAEMQDEKQADERAERQVKLDTAVILRSGMNRCLLLTLADAIEIRNELERLAEIEERYDDMMSAAEDRRWD